VRSSSPSLPLPCSVSLSKRKDHKLDGSKSVGIIELGSYETLLQYNCVMVVAPYVTRAVRRRARLLLPSARAPEPTDPHPTNPSLLLPPLPSPRLSLSHGVSPDCTSRSPPDCASSFMASASRYMRWRWSWTQGSCQAESQCGVAGRQQGSGLAGLQVAAAAGGIF
jgi:hypothetical protein